MSARHDRTGRGVLARLVAANALLEVQFWFPVWLFFLLDRGFTLTQAVLADGLFRFTVVAAEIPLGRWADRLGRRRTYVLLAAASTLVFLAVTAVHDLTTLLVVWICWGLVWALASGAAGAYLYDLAASGQIGGRPERGLALMRACAAAATLVSIVLAGHLYARSIALPFFATAALASVAFALALTLPAVTSTSTAPVLRLREAYGSSRLRALTGAAAVVLLFGWSTQVLFQPLSAERGWGYTTTGWVFAFFALSAMLGHAASTQWRERLTASVLTAWGAMVGAVALLAVASGAGTMAAMALLGFSAAFAGTSLESRLLEQAPSRARATVVGVVSALAGVGIGVARPGLGIITDHHTTGVAFAVWACCGVAMTVPLVLWLRRAAQPVAGR